MNRSGIPVERLMVQHAVVSFDLVVVLDDVALEFGTLASASGARTAATTGCAHRRPAGTDEFPRVRGASARGTAGIWPGRPVRVPPEDVLVVQEIVGWAADAVACLLREGAEEAMNRYNGPRRN